MLEALEQRRLLAVTVNGPDAHGWYTVTGTENADDFEVNLYSADSEFSVTDNKIPIGQPGWHRVFEGASHVEIQGLGGPDKIAVNELSGEPVANWIGSKVLGGSGGDTIELFRARSPWVEGGTGDDTIEVMATISAYVWGDAGNDTITSYTSQGSYMWGGPDNDTIRGTGDDENNIYQIFADGGHDDDLIYGTDDTDMLVGGEGWDEVYGNGGDDSINVTDSGGLDFADGGAGWDIAYSEDLTWDWVFTEEARDPLGNGW